MSLNKEVSENDSIFWHFWSVKILLHETKVVFDYFIANGNIYVETLKEQIKSLVMKEQDYENQADSIIKIFLAFLDNQDYNKRRKFDFSSI